MWKENLIVTFSKVLLKLCLSYKAKSKVYYGKTSIVCSKWCEFFF